MENRSSISFHRYIDDMFLIIQFSETATNEDIGTKMLDISTLIGEYLSNNLGLNLNPLKTRFDIVASESEVDDLIERSRLVSFYHPLPENGSESPKETFNRAIKVLKSLKEQFKTKGYTHRITSNDDLALKQCFKKSVVNYMNSEDAQQQLKIVFQDWHPVLLSKNIKILVFLISRVPDVLDTFMIHVSEYLKNPSPSLLFIHLAEHLMLIEEYDGELDDIINNLVQTTSNSYISLLGRLLHPVSPCATSYISIEDDCLRKHGSIMLQVRLTIIAERRNVHNLAYNHLLNTLHEWCFCNENPSPSMKNRSNYNRNEVVKWLESIASHSEIIFIMTMFDRRNRNTISHPGDDGVDVAPVNKIEYEQHLKKLNCFFVNLHKRLS